jgi:hypothetical protein
MQEAMRPKLQLLVGVTLARQAVVERPDEERYHGPTECRSRAGLTTLTCKKTKLLRRTQRWKPDCRYESDIDYETRI